MATRDPKPVECEGCGLYDSLYVPLQLISYPQYSILFVGQAPGHVETITRVPFTGPAGKMQFRLMAGAGLDKRNLSMTNLVACAPPGDREPSASEIKQCSGRLKREIQLIKPELIIALGAPATRALTGDTNPITKLRGEILDLLPEWEYPCKVLCCLHPSFVMRQRQWIEIASKDLTRVQRYLSGGIKKEEFNIILDPDMDTLCDYLANHQEEITAFDLETTGLKPRQDKILGISIGDSTSAVACYLYKEDPRWDPIQDYLTHESFKKVTQNGSFDCGFLLEQQGVVVRGLIFDTRLAEQLLHSDLPTNLQFLRQQYTSIQAYKPSEREIKNAISMSKERLLHFNCLDSITTHQVMQEQKKVLNKQEITLLEELLLPMVPCLNKMESVGVKVNIETLAGIYGQLVPKRDQLLEEFKPLGVNPASPVQICKHFGLKDSGVETLRYHIKRRDFNYEWFEKILEFRQYDKTISTYLRGVYDLLEGERIHTHYKLDGTGTGRLASENPNLQNVPDWLRVIYIPDSEEFKFVELDNRQLELRVVGLVSGEQELLDMLSSGGDPHEELRKIIYAGQVKTDRQRLITKAVLFGTLYGRAARSIAIEFGVTVAEAEGWQKSCIYRYPKLIEYRKRMDREVGSQGYLTSVFGRRRYITTQKQGYNFPIQSAASDICLTNLLKLYKEGFDLRLTVHDSILIQVKTREEVLKAKELIERPFKEFNNYIFPVKAKWGDDWYNLKEVI